MAGIVHVDLGERSYDIRIGRDLPVGTTIPPRAGLKALIVADSNVDPLHGAGCERLLGEAGLETVRVTVPAGESSKDAAHALYLYDKAIESGLDRSSHIVALGGGMVGDLAGFVAATFLRGIRLIQVPTSLVAMVDSSVGGKTAINLPQGKNLVGAFHQPVEVVADLRFLESFPRKEYISGLAEAVKCAVIFDEAFFDLMERNADRLLGMDAALLEKVVVRCCEIKARVVSSDERETGPRAVLNFGHTAGHAIEVSAGYGKYLHGEAVAMGMVFAAALSSRQTGLPRTDFDRLTGLLRKIGLPTRMPADMPWDDIRKAMTTDKKSKARVPHFVLAGHLGSAIIGCEAPEAVLADVFETLRADSD